MLLYLLIQQINIVLVSLEQEQIFYVEINENL